MGLLEQLAAELQTYRGGPAHKNGRRPSLKHDLDAGFTVSDNYMHGSTGIFGQPGIERDVFATRIHPQGLLSLLPSFGTVYENPIVAYLLGFTDDESGDEKSGVCDTPLGPGEMKSCLQGALFGRLERKTDVIEINKVGRTTNRGEFRDLRIVNDPLLDPGFSVPGVPREAAGVLNREVLAKFLALGIAHERLMGPLVYSGSPANNSAGGGYMEFHGLETLVGTGKIDVITNDTCPALDSFVHDMDYARVDTSANAYVEILTVAMRRLQHMARRMRMDPVDWRIVMREDLFLELVDIWPCAYATYRCTVDNVADSNIARVMVDGNEQRRMADAMRNGMYLLIDGRQIPVVVDDYIPEDTTTNNANVTEGCFASDIYILPMTVGGGLVSTYLEYYDYTAPNSVMQAVMDGRLGTFFWTDGGRFLWTFRQTGWCVEWWAKIEPRLRLLTPHLAARLQNVMYCPHTHLKEDTPSSDYFFDGGVTERSNAPYDSDDFP